MFVFLLAIPVHECGHWIGYRLFGFKPTLRLTKWGILYIGENIFYYVKAKQMLLISYLGILFGYVFLYFVTLPSNRTTIIVGYLFACIIDINWLIILFGVKDKNLTILEITRQNYQEIEAKFGGAKRE